MNEEKLYHKVGRRYVESHKFNMRPAPGIWIVERHPNGDEMRLVTRVGELPDLVPLLKLERHRTAVAIAIAECRDSRRNSSMDIADAVLRALAAETTERSE